MVHTDARLKRVKGWAEFRACKFSEGQICGGE